METIEFKSCFEFEEFVRQLKEERESVNPKPGKGGQIMQSKFLFRGQADSSWSLSTTLERAMPNRQLLYHYLELAWEVHKPFEAFTEKKWNIPDRDEFHKWQKYDPNYSVEGNLEKIGEYLVFLRHHGFPSPLLDWSESEYVAQFFAFEPRSCADRVVYIYQQTANGSMPYPNRIIRQAPWLRSATSRHFVQHCIFTISTDYSDSYGWSFVPHEAIATEHKGTGRHRLWKCIIPGKERAKVLKKLDDHSLNAFSLYNTTDSLASALATRFIDLRDERM